MLTPLVENPVEYMVMILTLKNPPAMRSVVKYLIPVALALVACRKEQNKVDPESVSVEPAAWFVEGLASADASNPATRSWNYSTAASGEEVLRFGWADNAYVPGSARFEGFWKAHGVWGTSDGKDLEMNTILNDEDYPTYVEHGADGDNIHVSLPVGASAATKLLVVYTGDNINHTYWFEDPDRAQVSLNEDGTAISLTFDGLNKLTHFIAGKDNNEVIYGVADITSDVLTPSGGQAAASVNFNFQHLESVFRVRMRNMSDAPVTLGKVVVEAASSKKGGGSDEPFAGTLVLTYADDAFVTEATYGSTWFYVDPVTSLPNSDNDNLEEVAVKVDPGEYYTVYMMPMANPACDISDWEFTFTTWTLNNVVIGQVTVPGSAIAEATAEAGETHTPLKPGYVYTVNMRIVSPYVGYDDGNGNTLRFIKSGSALKLLPPVAGETYSGDISIPASVTVDGQDCRVKAILEGAFKNQTGVTSVNIPASVTEFGQEVFMGCTGLTSITLPESVTSMSTIRMFSGCSNLTSVTLPNSGMKNMGTSMFEGCSSLASLTIPASVNTTVGYGIFKGCTALGGHITSYSDFAIVDDQGIVYTKERYFSNGYQYYYRDLLWIPENLTGKCTIPADNQYSGRILPYATYHLEVSELVIPNYFFDIKYGNFIETPKLTKLTVNWDSATKPKWNGYEGSNLDHDMILQWYFSQSTLEQRQAITLSVPRFLQAASYNIEPWLTFGFRVVARQ